MEGSTSNTNTSVETTNVHGNTNSPGLEHAARDGDGRTCDRRLHYEAEQTAVAGKEGGMAQRRHVKLKMALGKASNSLIIFYPTF